MNPESVRAAEGNASVIPAARFEVLKEGVSKDTMPGQSVPLTSACQNQRASWSWVFPASTA